MRKRALSCAVAGIIGLTAVLLCSLEAGTARAANIPYSMSVTPFAGGYVFEGNQHITDRPVYGISVGYNLSEHWGLEATYSGVPDAKNSTGVQTDVPAGVETRITVHGVRGDILYHFFPDRRLVPYVAAGAGSLLITSSRSTNVDILVDYGAGLKYFLTDSVALRADVRHIFDITFHDRIERRDFYNNLAYTAGFTFQVGGVKPPARPVAEEKPVVAPAPEPAPVTAPEAAPTTPPEPAKPAPLAVTGILLQKSVVEITANQPIKDYKASLLSGPSRLVLDIPNAVNSFGAKRVPVHADGIATVLLEEYPDHLRIVLDAEQDQVPPYRIVETDSGLKVVIEPQTATVPEAPAPQPATNEGAATTGVTVTAITAEQQAVEIATTEFPMYKTFRLIKPPRLVIDIANATNAVGARRIPIHKFGIAVVRLGSHPGYLRIVLDAVGEKLPAYRIIETERGLKIDLAAPVAE